MQVIIRNNVQTFPFFIYNEYMEDLSFLKHALQMAGIRFKENEPLAPKTTFKVGSTAALFLSPSTVDQFRGALSSAKSQGCKYFVLGGGSNVVFPDSPYEGIIISTQELNNILVTDDEIPGLSEDEVLVTCQAGTSMASFVNFCTNHNFTGAEQFAGLPGTIGGAVYMNARCFEKSISDILFSTEHIELLEHGKSNLINLPFDSSMWDYKKSPFQTDNRYVVTATFKLLRATSDKNEQIEKDCKKFISERVDKGHFKFPSAGSVFKNNHTFGKPSGKLIDEAGLKGTAIGGAQIAPFHGNFIINTNKATANDIKQLVELCQKTVKEKFGFNLEPEIIFV